MFRSIFKTIPLGLLSSALTSIHHSDSLFFQSKRIRLAGSLVLGTIFNNNTMMMVNQLGLNHSKNLSNGYYSSKFRLVYRFMELFVIFLPSIILTPFAFFPLTRKIWISVFVKGVKKAGVVWIKLFQYLSHRRDVLGETMAESFAPLRQFAPQHSIKQTNQIFQRLYGNTIQKYFEEFNPIPIASGSVSQVYVGKLHDEKVAIKVRHPNIEKNIQCDISIIFSISNFLTNFSQIFQIPVNEHSLKQMLTEQIKFGKQSQNLKKFSKIFKNPDVAFPRPFIETTDQVLIMSFVPGKPISYFENNSHNMNKFIARIGASAFFEMLIQHNFIHADCHGGNIFVEIGKRQSGIFSYFEYCYRVVKDVLWNKSIKFMLDSERLKKLCDQQNTQDLELKKQLMEVDQTVKVTLLDVGMVIELQKNKRNYFINFLSEVIQGNPSQCAKMIHKISKYAGELLSQKDHPQYLLDLEKMFTLVRKVSLEKLQGIDVLSGMLTVIRNHRMKLDGQFATLLTNMLTLEAIAKDLDPNINILRCAVPYLPYK